MKRKYRSTFLFAYILIILVGVIWHTGGVSAENTIKLTVNSKSTNTAAMTNMKPGDELSSEYTIINEGSEVFNYFVDFKFISGDVELYNILQMTLEKEGVVIYSGPMSKASGRVTIGSLTGGGQSVIQMDVTFPLEAGNEYQGKSTSVAFEFSASGEPNPSSEPSASPTPSPTPSPMPTATATDASIPSTQPSAGPVETPPVVTTTSPTASPDSQDINVTEAPIPLGGGNDDNDDAVTPTQSAGSDSSNNPETAEPDHEVTLVDDDLPLAVVDEGDKLPDTAEPWYNLILICSSIAVISFIVLRRLKTKR